MTDPYQRQTEILLRMQTIMDDIYQKLNRVDVEEEKLLKEHNQIRQRKVMEIKRKE